MKTSRFSETQIISILNQGDSGIKVKDLCREQGISDATYDPIGKRSTAAWKGRISKVSKKQKANSVSSNAWMLISRWKIEP